MAQINPKSLRSNSVSENLAKSMISLRDTLAAEELAYPLAQALCETFLHVNNPEPLLTESILVCLRDVCGEAMRDKLVTEALIAEIGETLSLQTLFRSGSVGTRLFAALYRTEGVEWLSQALRPLFNEVSNLTHPVEFDPSKVPPESTPDDIARSAQEFEAIAKRFFNHLFMLAEDFPPCISRVLYPVCEAAEKKFPGRGASVAGIGLVILRYVSPAVLQPGQFNVPQPELSPIATRVIVVLSKVIQMVANGVVVKANDVAMQPIASFIQSLFTPCADFIKNCTKNPEIAPLPPPSTTESFGKDLRNALKVLAAEIDKSFDKINAKAKEDSNAGAMTALQRYKNPAKRKDLDKARVASGATPTKNPSRLGFFRGDHKQEGEEDMNLPSVEPPATPDEAVAAAHKAFEDILMRYRASVLAHTGENFSNIVNEFEKCKADLQEEREQRKIAERMVQQLQTQVQQLQEEVASLKANKSSVPLHVNTAWNNSTPAPAGPATTPAAAAQQEVKSPTQQLNMMSHLPCAALNRQAVALLDEILMLSGRISRVSQVLYLARIVRELQRLIRTPFNEPFEFGKNLAYNPNAGEDSSVSFEDEKMHGLRRAIPDCINKVRDWCVNMLEDGVVSPQYYPSVSLRMQNLVDLLKDMSRTLRGSIFS